MNDAPDENTGSGGSGNSDGSGIPDIVKDILDTPIPDVGTHIKVGSHLKIGLK